MITRARNWLAYHLANWAVTLATPNYKSTAYDLSTQSRLEELGLRPVTSLLPSPPLPIAPPGWEIEAETLNDGPPLCRLHRVELMLKLRDRTPVGPPAPVYYCPICEVEGT